VVLVLIRAVIVRLRVTEDVEKQAAAWKKGFQKVHADRKSVIFGSFLHSAKFCMPTPIFYITGGWGLEGYLPCNLSNPVRHQVLVLVVMPSTGSIQASLRRYDGDVHHCLAAGTETNHSHTLATTDLTISRYMDDGYIPEARVVTPTKKNSL
jgi:hypothetical protein